MGIRAVVRQRYRLRANAAPGFQDFASRLVYSVGVKQFNKGGRLILQTDTFPWIVAVHICRIRVIQNYSAKRLGSAVGRQQSLQH